MKGVFAAAATPMRGDGRMDVEVFERLIDFLIGAGVHGVCLGGATSEYPRTDLADRAIAIAAARTRLPRGRALLVGIGAPALRHRNKVRPLTCRACASSAGLTANTPHCY